MKANQSLDTKRFPVVGVVASAGGLEAMKQLLSSVPIDCEMAFVLVPHLDPKHESQMVALLSKICVLPVIEAEQGMVVETNHVYVIPSKNFLTIDHGILQLSDPPIPQGHETAIDFFLRSLANDQGERSVGIVLSGTGSHGTLGMREVKLVGGMAIAQQPSTAEFDTMPSSVIQEGLADYVLPPAEMVATLIEYIRQPYIRHAHGSNLDASTEEDYLTTILTQVHKQTQYDFRSYRKNMMQRRIQRRMGLLHLDDLQQYVDRIKSDPQEAVALYRDLLISVTAFFRDPDAYQALHEQLLLDVTTRDPTQFPFRIWVPGCATGEEAYSMALLLIECLDERMENDCQPSDSKNCVQVFASDVDEAAIAVARTGVYPSSIASDVSQSRLDRFFTKVEQDQFQIGTQLRESIVFSKQNLITDAPFSRLNLICCRNLLIYLEPEVQQQVISLFHFALSDQGILMLGPSESIAQADGLFEPLSKKWRIFRKLTSNQPSRIPIPLISGQRQHGTNTMQSASPPPRKVFRELVEKALIRHYAPATALINQRHEILYTTGSLVEYLEFPAGEPSHNLLSMCRPGLRTKLRYACQKSVTEDRDTEVVTQMKRGHDTIDCCIEVRVLKQRQNAESLLLVSFTDRPRDEVRSASVISGTLDVSTSPYAEQLERELRSNSEELGGVIEELEGTNEELKTSNEEIMSMNEELQSANEELETSKEELQSLNEELSTVNLELLAKVAELDVANNDILNLLASTEIATLFLDEQLLIQKFTPPTKKLLNVRESDVGRPLSDITTRFIDNCLISDCRKVIQEGTPIQSEVEGEHARMYLRRILPYRSQGDQILGVVITFIDLTDRLLLEKSLKQSKDHLEAILDSAVDAILTVDSQGIIARLNPATERLFGDTHDNMLGSSVMSLLTSANGDLPINQPEIQMLPLSTCASGNYLELKAKRKNGTSFDAELTLSRIDPLSLFIVVIRDVSQRKNLQRRVLEIASDEQRRIGQELHDGTQQELTGLSLIAGTIEEFLHQKMQSVNEQGEPLFLDQTQISTLLLNASKLVQGLNQANQHVQSLSHGIMPVQIDVEGLHSALTELANETTVEGKVDCTFVHTGSLTIDTSEIATHLYRIAQEAVTNAQRHSRAKNICVSLVINSQQVQLEITDDGRGMDAIALKSSDNHSQGRGLQIMEYRANVIGGELSVVEGKHKGTTVRCIIQKYEERNE